jgi:hypothetical protein
MEAGEEDCDLCFIEVKYKMDCRHQNFIMYFLRAIDHD